MSTVTGTLQNIQSNTNQVNFTHNQTELGTTQLNEQDFLQLMMAQLQNQDPTNPTDDSTFLTQQAQLTQVQELQSVGSTLQTNSNLSEASTLVGKTVDVQDSSNNTVTGEVQSASLSNGTAGITINGTTYTLSQITKIYDDSPTTGTGTTTGTGNTTATNTSTGTGTDTGTTASN